MLIDTENLYQRPRIDYPGPVKPEDNVKNTKDHYIIENLPGKRVIQRWTQYPVQWLGYGPEHNVCHPMIYLNT